MKEDGWEIVSNENDGKKYLISLKVPVKKLPISKAVGPASFLIKKDGLVEVGISVGDADAISKTKIQLPKSNNQILPLSSPVMISNSGGEYASGAWSFNGKLVLKTLP